MTKAHQVLLIAVMGACVGVCVGAPQGEKCAAPVTLDVKLRLSMVEEEARDIAGLTLGDLRLRHPKLRVTKHEDPKETIFEASLPDGTEKIYVSVSGRLRGVAVRGGKQPYALTLSESGRPLLYIESPASGEGLWIEYDAGGFPRYMGQTQGGKAKGHAIFWEHGELKCLTYHAIPTQILMAGHPNTKPQQKPATLDVKAVLARAEEKVRSVAGLSISDMEKRFPKHSSKEAGIHTTLEVILKDGAKQTACFVKDRLEGFIVRTPKGTSYSIALSRAGTPLIYTESAASGQGIWLEYDGDGTPRCLVEMQDMAAKGYALFWEHGQLREAVYYPEATQMEFEK